MSEARERTNSGRSRVSADVLGEELWFESDDVALNPSSHALATALLAIAAISGSSLELASPVEAFWSMNAARVLRTWSEWWGTDASYERIVGAPSTEPASGRRLAATGLCFTLGVDSFYTLLRSGHRVDRLVVAHGYDIALGDASRIKAVDESLDAVAKATGTSKAIVRTNLREHPVGVHMDWERGHGGAIAAIGHVCDEQIGELLISSSFPRFDHRPWGSHHQTDPRWSSSRLRVTHVGDEIRRAHKLGSLVGEELVQEHLRVCWENRSPSGNCGECEKCVRTMLVLNTYDSLDRFGVFPQDGLVQRVDALPSLSWDLPGPYRGIAGETRQRDVRRAIGRLLRRTEDQAGTGSRFRFVRRGFGAGSDAWTSSRKKRPV